MKQNGQPEPQVEVFSVPEGGPNVRFGMPAIAGKPGEWVDGMLFVLRVEGRMAWLEPYMPQVDEETRRAMAREATGTTLDPELDRAVERARRGGVKGVARHHTPPPDFEPDTNS